jgi:phosphate transport system permease protein
LAQLAQLPDVARQTGVRNAGDRIFQRVLAAAAGVVLVIMGGVALTSLVSAVPAIQAFGLGFFTGMEWNPVARRFGGLPFVYGTLVSSLIALSIAVPVGLGVSTFLSELTPRRLRDPIRFLVELLAAIPSVVYGLWGIFVLIPWVRTVLEPVLARTLGFLPLFQGPPLGIGTLAAGLVLSIMIIPFIVAVSTEVMRAVPRMQREAALSLGATSWETTIIAVIPYARSGIMGAIFLALARAVGETMAVVMVIGNVPQIKASLFAPASTIAGVIANEFAEASDPLLIGALLYVGLILMVVTVLINVLARLLVMRVAKGPSLVRD